MAPKIAQQNLRPLNDLTLGPVAVAVPILRKPKTACMGKSQSATQRTDITQKPPEAPLEGHLVSEGATAAFSKIEVSLDPRPDLLWY